MISNSEGDACVGIWHPGERQHGKYSLLHPHISSGEWLEVRCWAMVLLPSEVSVQQSGVMASQVWTCPSVRFSSKAHRPALFLSGVGPPRWSVVCGDKPTQSAALGTPTSRLAWPESYHHLENHHCEIWAEISREKELVQPQYRSRCWGTEVKNLVRCQPSDALCPALNTHQSFLQMSYEVKKCTDLCHILQGSTCLIGKNLLLACIPLFTLVVVRKTLVWRSAFQTGGANCFCLSFSWCGSKNGRGSHPEPRISQGPGDTARQRWGSCGDWGMKEKKQKMHLLRQPLSTWTHSLI